MALDPIIIDDQTDAKSPIDQQLMDGIRENLERIDTEITQAGGTGFEYKVNGNLDNLTLGSTPEKGLGLDAAFVGQERVLQKASLFLAGMGAGGAVEIDIKRLKFLGLPISGIKNIFTANTQSIARASGTLTTQSITKAESDLDTQAISYTKAALNITSIIQVTGSSLFRCNLDAALDEDYKVNDYIEISGCDNALNDGVFQIKEVSKDNGNNVVVENLNGVAQLAASGAVQLLLVSYTYLAAIPSNFTAGEDFVTTGHTDASNDGTFTIYKTNQAGNNILVYRTTALVPQAGAAGQAETLRYQYNFLSSVLGAFTVGEVSLFSGHANAANDGSFEIKETNNNAGFNIVVYNTAGVVQGGVQGSVDTNRWVYALDSDPDGLFAIGDSSILTGHDNALNDGTFEVVDVRYLATNNIVIYNVAGVVQVGPNGTVDHVQKAITFDTDYASNFEAGKSSVEIQNTFNGLNDGTFLVVGVNRTAISAFNIICNLTSGLLQTNDDGQIFSEVRSIFTAGSLTMDAVQDKQVKTVTSIGGEITTDPLGTDTILQLDVLQAPASCTNLAVNVN